MVVAVVKVTCCNGGSCSKGYSLNSSVFVVNISCSNGDVVVAHLATLCTYS